MRVSFQSVGKSYGSVSILENFSLDVPSGSRLCLCGHNGSGKSTVLRLVSGKESLDSGKIITQKGCRIGYVEQDLAEEDLALSLLSYVLKALPDWSVFWDCWERALARGDSAAMTQLMQRQSELEQAYGYNPENQAKTVLSGLGFEQRQWAASLGELSGGWRERAKLARVLTQGADLLLLDEPTNHLDLDAVEWLESFLLDFSGTLLFVAHDRVFMDKIGTHILFFSGNGRPLYRKGNFSKFILLQEEISEQRAREAARVQEEIERKMDFVRRFKAKASKARQAVSKQKMAKKLEKELEGLQAEQKRKDLRFAWPQATRAERTVLAVSDLCFSFPDQKSMWDALSFTLYRGQKIALAGKNGCGKSTLLRLLMGRLEKNSGQIVVGPSVRLGYYSQDQLDMLQSSGTVLGEIRRLSDARTTEEELMGVLGLFQLGQSFFDRTVAHLSGGERARLALASLFLARCNVLILDEPTNHLDLESREALIEALELFDGTILFVAHDRHLLDIVAEEIWELDAGLLIRHEHGFAAYNQARKERQNFQETQKPAFGDAVERRPELMSREAARRIRREQAEARKRLHLAMKPLQEKYAELERDLEQSISEQAALEAAMNEDAFHVDGKKAADLLKRHHELQLRIEAQMISMEQEEIKLSVLEGQRRALQAKGGEDAWGE